MTERTADPADAIAQAMESMCTDTLADLPGVLVYGRDRSEAIARVQALALRVVAERLEHGETASEPLSVSFRAA